MIPVAASFTRAFCSTIGLLADEHTGTEEVLLTTQIFAILCIGYASVS